MSKSINPSLADQLKYDLGKVIPKLGSYEAQLAVTRAFEAWDGMIPRN